jgi:hypothetical protein
MALNVMLLTQSRHIAKGAAAEWGSPVLKCTKLLICRKNDVNLFIDGFPSSQADGRSHPAAIDVLEQESMC